MAVAPRAAGDVIAVAGAIEIVGRRRQQHLAGERRDGRLALGGGTSASSHSGSANASGIEQRKRIEASAARAAMLFARANPTLVGRRISSTSRSACSASRSESSLLRVVDDDDVVGTPALPLERLQAPAQQVAAIPVDDRGRPPSCGEIFRVRIDSWPRGSGRPRIARSPSAPFLPTAKDFVD